MPLRFAPALLAVGLWLAAVSSAGAQAPAEISITLVNRSGAALRELFLTPAGDANWGRNRLAEPLPAGASIRLRRRSDGNCIFDLRAAFADGSREERRGLNLCTLDPVAVGAPAKPTDDPSFRLINRGTRPIAQLFVSEAGRQPSGASAWGENRLGSEGLPPNAARIVRLPRTGQCLYDLRVVFADHKALEKRRADLCRITDLPVP
jgi:hypothetical protein